MLIEAGREYGAHEEKKNTLWVCWGHLKEGDHFEHLGVGGRITLKWIFLFDRFRSVVL
jgi:hypothetical protein